LNGKKSGCFVEKNAKQNFVAEKVHGAGAQQALSGRSVIVQM